MNELATLLRRRVSDGLKRSSITTVTEWAKHYRVMGAPYPGPWSHLHHPWSVEPQDCRAEIQCAQKAAQMSFTEIGMNKAFKAIDIDGLNVLYILPSSHPDAKDFSTSRFDAALELSPHLMAMFTDTKNVGHKRAGSANLFIRGSRSRAQLKSIPAPVIIFDEMDEMVQKNIPLAYERQSGQTSQDRQIYHVSTPTIDDFGINALFRISNQCHYFFKCPHCSKITELAFPDCLFIAGDNAEDPRVKESYIFCKECKHKLDHNTKTEWLSLANSEWVPAYSDREIVGWYINQLYSMPLEPYKIAISFHKAKVDPTEEQELWNSKGGLPHVVEGGKITEEEVKQCVGEYTSYREGLPNRFVTMGIDVGKVMHVEIDAWHLEGRVKSVDLNLLARCQVLNALTVHDFEDLDELMYKYRVNFAVIDIEPETRSSLDFARRFLGSVRMCRYSRGISGKVLNDDEANLTVSVDRTAWLDLALHRFRKKSIALPADIPLEYRMHIQVPARIYKKDNDGNAVGYYESGNKADHYAHARNYAEVALPLGLKLSGNRSMRGNQ